MGDRKALLTRLYAAFNDRDVATLVGGMHPDVSWPNFLEGGRVEGREALTAYWTGQFAMVTPEASPIEMRELPDGRIVVRLHYVIKATEGGGVWTDEITSNTFTFEGDEIIRMDWGEPEDSPGASDALIVALFDAFNARDLEAAKALIHPEADWPDVFSEGRLHGRDQVLAMWSEQFRQFSPECFLIEMTALPDGRRRVRTNHVVRNLDGKIFTDEQATMTYKFRDGLIARIDWSV
ncbi:MAG: nuclear transport factor 2 family protein [Caulobacter sp.]|nr:nuclear transport factor 2 family protein [Caulobacter sp.]